MPPFSWMIFLTMSAIFLASTAVFFVLVRRWTTERRWTAMSVWARERGYRYLRPSNPLPQPLDETDLLPQLVISSGTVTLLDMSPPMSAEPIHVLHRKLDWPIAPGGLRPVARTLSLLDRFKLQSFPLITGGERFLAIGVDSAAARRIADALRTLFPADLGVLVYNRSMLIDFSSRQFDTIEFDRVIALSEQLLKHLPPPSGL